MPTEENERIQVPQETPDLIVLPTLAAMGPEHACSISARLKHASADSLARNQCTLHLLAES